LPTLRGSDGALRFAAIERWEDVRPGRYGVPEPRDAHDSRALERSDLVMVPGLAFDSDGRRVGTGAGYYDRTFPVGTPAPFLVGLAFDFQRVDRVPAAAHDRAVDALVTEAGIWRCRWRRA
jgi:5-formyltetrahydrofolate cyclo-ligase